jgi:putative nucleotidyltransferase with HDIG domain
MSIVLDKPKVHNIAQEIRETGIDTEEYTTRLELLYEVAQKAGSYPEVLRLIEEILGVTQRILQASGAALLLIDEGKGELCFQAAGDKATNTLRHVRLDLESGIVGWVARHGVAVVASDVCEDKRFNKDIDEFSGLVAKSIIVAPLVRGQKVIAVLEVLNKADGSEFSERDLAFLTGFASTEALILLVSMAATAIHNIKLRQAELNNHKRTVETLVAATDVKDPYACGHSQRVREYTLLAANSLSLSPEELQVIEFGALLHDIGKIGVDDCILRKPTSLTNEEWYVMRKHSLIGANIVGEIPFLEKAKGIVLSHHEWYNGTGYPEGRKGEDIPLGARLVAVADAFDTMITDHSYRAALSVDEAIGELVRGSGSQFCPVAVKAFISAFKKQREELEKDEAERAAEEEAEKARKAEEATALRNEGKALVRLGKEEEALEVFVKAIELDPRNAASWRSKGVALGRLGRDEEALKAFVKAVELDPANAEAWRNRGTALVRLGRDKEALQDFLKAIELNPEYATTWVSKVTALFGLGRDEEARKVREAKKLVKREADLVAKGRSKRGAEELREARGTEKPVKEKANTAAAEEARGEVGEARKVKSTGTSIHHIGSELYGGDVQLAIRSSASFEQVNQFRQCLRAVEDLRIVLDSWSEDAGILIVVSLQKTMPLGTILRRMSIVEQVYQEGKNIVVELNTTVKYS